MKIDKEDPIIIIGAGLAGVTTALALQQLAFTQVHIYETEQEIEGLEIPVHLGAPLLSYLEKFEWVGNLVELGYPWKQMVLSWQNGKILKTGKLDKVQGSLGYAPLSISGKVLYQFLKNKLAPGTIISGKTFISFTQQSKGVEVHFADNESIPASLLIGADGLRSRVRLQMLGEAPVETDQMICYHALMPASTNPEGTEEWRKNPLIEIIGPKLSFTMMNVSHEIWGVTVKVPRDNKTREEMQDTSLPELFGALFKKFAAPVQAVVQAVPEERWIEERIQAKDPIKTWHKGRVVLVGDAIHSLPGYLGLGPTLAMESSVALAATLDQNQRGLDKGLKRFEQKRIKRTRLAFKLGRRHGRLLDWTNPLSLALRNMMMPNYPTGFGSNAFYQFHKGTHLL